MLDVILLVAGLLAILVAALLRHLQRWSISPPLLGLLAGVVIGPEVLAAVAFAPGEDVRVLTVAARLLLAVSLMAVALRYPISDARLRTREVGLLLVVVLPVMTAVLASAGVWALQVPLAVALPLAAALTPTDPVLASGIVTGDPAEVDIPAPSRQILSLESGANDGLAMPLVVLALAYSLDLPVAGEVGRAVYEVLGGLVVGVAAGWAAGRALRWSTDRREMDTSVEALYSLVVAGAVLGLGGLLHVDGLLSVFVAGLVHNAIVTGGERAVEVGIDESLNHFLVVPVFVLLGVALPWGGWADLGGTASPPSSPSSSLRRLPHRPRAAPPPPRALDRRGVAGVVRPRRRRGAVLPRPHPRAGAAPPDAVGRRHPRHRGQHRGARADGRRGEGDLPPVGALQRMSAGRTLMPPCAKPPPVRSHPAGAGSFGAGGGPSGPARGPGGA